MTKYLVKYVKRGEGLSAIPTGAEVLPFQINEWREAIATKKYRGKRIVIKGIYKFGKDAFDLIEVDHL